MKNKQTLYNNIKALRKSKGLTQSDLAKQLGISRTAMGSIERGEAYPAADIALAMCHILECRFEEIFYF